jgi:hypothetical protein
MYRILFSAIWKKVMLGPALVRKPNFGHSSSMLLPNELFSRPPLTGGASQKSMNTINRLRYVDERFTLTTGQGALRIIY